MLCVWEEVKCEGLGGLEWQIGLHRRQELGRRLVATTTTSRPFICNSSKFKFIKLWISHGYAVRWSDTPLTDDAALFAILLRPLVVRLYYWSIRKGEQMKMISHTTQLPRRLQGSIQHCCKARHTHSVCQRASPFDTSHITFQNSAPSCPGCSSQKPDASVPCKPVGP